ncbi:hypothetical protein H8356DRAFT_1318413 [Neocallimastix lanati (nom. inval.)]|nr:hypothetical protein H8356DRAFT_1318413 [Neocallimastix sp. JGI-2020a]
MDKKNKSNKAPENTRKTTRSGSLKSSVGSVTAESSPTPVEAPPSRRQNTGDKKMTSTPEKPAASKPKPAAAPEKSQPEASKPEAKKQTLEDYVTCLRRCDTFPAEYKDDYLERYEYNRERKIAIIALLGMMDPRRPSKDIEAKRRRNSDNRRGDKRDFSRKEPTKQNNYDKNKKDGYNHNSGKDFNSRTSSNNPIPKTALLMQAGSEYEEFVPEAKISNLRTKEGLQDLNVLYDTGSQINMIHPQLAKEMGLKTEDRPLTFTTAAGKVLISQVTEEFKIKIKLVEERTGKVKWYDFNTRCRLAENDHSGIKIHG